MSNFFYVWNEPQSLQLSLDRSEVVISEKSQWCRSLLKEIKFSEVDKVEDPICILTNYETRGPPFPLNELTFCSEKKVADGLVGVGIIHSKSDTCTVSCYFIRTTQGRVEF
jgi:hypothetical protein